MTGERLQFLRHAVCSTARSPDERAAPTAVEWSDNISISDSTPASYFPKYASRFSAEDLARMCYWHALPEGWEEMTYRDFLEARRKAIALVIIRDGFFILANA